VALSGRHIILGFAIATVAGAIVAGLMIVDRLATNACAVLMTVVFEIWSTSPVQ